MIRVVLTVVACAMLVGYINGQSLAQCEKAGNTEAICFTTLNP